MAVFLAAFNMMASVEVLVVLMLADRVKLDAKVSTVMVPEPIIPVLLPTVPMVNPLEASTIWVAPIKLPTAPPAMVAKLLDVLVNVNVPVPFKANPFAVIAAV